MKLARVIPINTAKPKKRSHDVHYSSAKSDWETPHELFAKLDAEFHFTLDVCATKENAKCEKFISPEEDALRDDVWWTGMCWMNPPYGREIGKWVKKACLSTMWPMAPGELLYPTVVCLLPARTDTKWWHDYVIPKANEIRFLKGRLKFVGAKSSAPFPSAVVVFGGTKR